MGLSGVTGDFEICERVEQILADGTILSAEVSEWT